MFLGTSSEFLFKKKEKKKRVTFFIDQIIYFKKSFYMYFKLNIKIKITSNF